MTDPIEQAWREYDGATARGNEDGWTPARIQFANEKQSAVEQAIIRYHPDVVRLVLAARRAVPILDGVEEQVGESPQEWTQRADASANSITAALVPFTEVQE